MELGSPLPDSTVLRYGDSFGSFQSSEKIHLENYGEIVHAFLFSVAGSQGVLFNSRQAEKWWRTQFALHLLSNGPKDVKKHHKAVRKERNQGLYMPLSWNLV